MIANRVIGGNGGETASIFVTGLSETDTVTATKDGKTYSGKWVSKEFYQTTSYRYIKWLITEQKSANSSGCQASEFGFYDKDGNRFNFPAGTLSTQSCAETANETAEKLIDNNTSTKFNYGSNNSKYPNVSVQFDLGAGNEINLNVYSKYYWYTANDAEGRDPISWTLYGSNDGTTWDVIDEQLNQTITSSRLSKAGEWTIDTSVKTDYGWFIEGMCNYGTYTIIATDGTNTATQDVLVDMATQYDVEMTLSGKLYLYNLGDECEDVTGGWNTTSWSMNSIGVVPVITRYNDHIRIDQPSVVDRGGALFTSLKIDATNYNKIFVTVKATSQNRFSSVGIVQSSQTSGVNKNGMISENIITSWNSSLGPSDFDGTISFDLQQVDSYIGIAILSPQSGSASYADIYKIWLE